MTETKDEKTKFLSLLRLLPIKKQEEWLYITEGARMVAKRSEKRKG